MSDTTRLRQPGLIVYLSGLGSSALALWLVHLLNDHDINAMGLYANGILPVGALLVGLFSGLGYAAASRLLQVKLGRAFIWGMVTTAIVDYASAQYLTYLHIIEQHQIPEARYTFLQYVRDICEHMTMKSSSSHDAGTSLGWFGYFFKFLEVGGYVLGAIMPSVILAGMPYCKGCQLYLKAHRTGYIHAAADWATVKKLKKAERASTLQDAINDVCVRAQTVFDGTSTAAFDQTDSVVSELAPKSNPKVAASVAVALKKCPGCGTHHLSSTLHNWTVQKKPRQTPLAKVMKPAVVA